MNSYKSIRGKWCKYLMFKFKTLITINFEPISYQIFENRILKSYNSYGIVQFNIWKTHDENTLLSKLHTRISVK